MSWVVLNAAAEKSAESPLNFFPDPENCNIAQIIFLICMYGYVLFVASNLISDGSELLLLVPSLAPLVGSVVLPILGAVPDGAMVLFSGLGSDAQNQVAVGVGALAGSTVMLLTLPWFLAILAGRVNLINGKPQYVRPQGADPNVWEKLQPAGNFSLLQTGIGYGKEINANAKIMLITMIGYLIIQGVTFTVDHPKKDYTAAEMLDAQNKESRAENKFALLGFVFCIAQFAWYLSKQWMDMKQGSAVDNAIAETAVQAMKDGTLSLRGAMSSFCEKNKKLSGKSDFNEVLLCKDTMDEVRRMCKVLAPFFAKYDVNKDGTCDFEEFRMIFRDVGENISREAQAAMFKAADTNGSGDISFEEFVACLLSFAVDPICGLDNKDRKPKFAANTSKYLPDNADNEDGDDDEEEEEDVPEDLADLEPEEQQRRIQLRAAYQMAAGTLLVLIFSDPMVDLLSELGKRLDISAFYISFVLAPMASNASELVAAYNYAQKRTGKSITTSLSTLVGAAIMNNTFCLGIFLGLVYFKGLAWEFSAETICIMFVQLAMATMVLTRRVHRLLDGFVILSFYPISLFIVYFLENIYGLD
eukprot:TRINITY_DN88126_c0_g1_i1.p1 TRINITY_DN88126_c0_g1~~TRINITY_DN88126_c0_g1_i1.p1  ORF type:complete len:586 (+),score=136.86 TRINITY_DN88126_c0_g1_i1:117-1874(+)